MKKKAKRTFYGNTRKFKHYDRRNMEFHYMMIQMQNPYNFNTKGYMQNLSKKVEFLKKLLLKLKNLYVEDFGRRFAFSENLIDPKILHSKSQIKRKSSLKKQVEALQLKLSEQVTQDNEDNESFSRLRTQ